MLVVVIITTEYATEGDVKRGSLLLIPNWMDCFCITQHKRNEKPLLKSWHSCVGNHPSYDRREACTCHYREQWRHRHGFNDHHLQHSSDWNCQWDPLANIVRRKHPGSLQEFLMWKKRFKPEGSEKYKEVNNNIKRWMKEGKKNSIRKQCDDSEETLRKNNSKRAYQLVKDLTTVKKRESYYIQDHSGKCLTKEPELLYRWTKYCSELWNYKANGDPFILNSPQTDTEDDHHILRNEVEAAVESMKNGKSAGVDNIPAELVRAAGEDVITALTTICDKIWQTGEWLNPVLSHHISQERQPAGLPELPNDQPHRPLKQSHSEDRTGQIEATSGDHRWRTGRLQSRKEHYRAGSVCTNNEYLP